jgi:hypothetical protein
MRNRDLCSGYDLSSVKSIFSGAAPLALELANDFLKIYPDVSIRLAYGEENPSEVYIIGHH